VKKNDMNRVVADQEQRANGSGEPAPNGNGVFHFGQKSQEPNPIDAMRATADQLVRIATKAFMQMRNVDYATAQRWILGAAVREAKNKKPAPKSRTARS
jgi:hypothetical protein